MNYLLIAMLVLNVLLVGLIVFDYFQGKLMFSKERIWPGAVLFSELFVLYLLGNLHQDVVTSLAIFRSLSSAVESFVVKLNFEEVMQLFESNVLFSIVYVMTLLLTYYYIASIAISFILRKKANQREFKKRIKDKVTVLVGLSEETRKYLAWNNTANTTLWIASEKIDTNGIDVPIYYGEFTSETMAKLCKDDNTHFISFITDDLLEIQLVNEYYKVISKKTYESVKLTIITNMKQNNVFDEIIEAINEKKGKIKVINQNEIIAESFIAKHPLSYYLNEDYIDYTKGILKEDKDIQVLFIGFGYINEQIYLKSVMNNQFVTMKDGEVVSKPVNYVVFDKENKPTNRFLNYTIERYQKDHYADNDAYFEQVEDIKHFKFEPIDVDHKDFHQTLSTYLKKKNTKTFVFISIGNDIENLDLAIKTRDFLALHQMNDIELFVRVKQYEAVKNIFNIEMLDNLHIYGAMHDYLNEQVIYDEQIDKSAKQRAMIYEEEKSQDKTVSKREQLLLEQVWNSLNDTKKTSNYYSQINVLFKLHLLGYDITENEVDKVDYDVFYKHYDPHNERFKTVENVPECYREIDDTPRDILSIQEKNRWNAFHIVKGFLPLEKDKIKVAADGKILYKDDMKLRLHACLTTRAGLIDYYYQLINKQKEAFKTKEKTEVIKEETIKQNIKGFDVIKYDYQSLDSLEKDLDKRGLFITYKK